MLVKELGKGGFFGEVALVTKAETRVADCIAKTRSTLNIHPAYSTADISRAKEGALCSVIGEVLKTTQSYWLCVVGGESVYLSTTSVSHPCCLQGLVSALPMDREDVSADVDYWRWVEMHLSD